MKEHRAIVDAIRCRKPEKAREAVPAHMRKVGVRLKEVFEREGEKYDPSDI
jgi:DNA-binding GntR family transcriptional regulator